MAGELTPAFAYLDIKNPAVIWVTFNREMHAGFVTPGIRDRVPKIFCRNVLKTGWRRLFRAIHHSAGPRCSHGPHPRLPTVSFLPDRRMPPAL